jgi:hypothetical protein
MSTGAQPASVPQADGANVTFRPPVITGLWDELPKEGPRVVRGTTDQRLLWFADSESSSTNAWVSEVPDPDGPEAPRLVAYSDGSGPQEYTLTWRQYWRQVPKTYTHVPPGNTTTVKYTQTTGISTTDAQSFSAELGASVEGLSAKLQEAFSSSITTSTETSEELTKEVGAPEPGITRVWVMWQLVDEVVALMPDGEVLPPVRGEGTVARIPSTDLTEFEAFLTLPNTQQTYPGDAVVPDQKDFPTSMK